MKKLTCLSIILLMSNGLCGMREKDQRKDMLNNAETLKPFLRIEIYNDLKNEIPHRCRFGHFDKNFHFHGMNLPLAQGYCYPFSNNYCENKDTINYIKEYFNSIKNSLPHNCKFDCAYKYNQSNQNNPKSPPRDNAT